MRWARRRSGTTTPAPCSESYYTRYEPSDFAVQVWTNNARIAAVCVASGITGILPAYMLFINAFSVGKAAAIMAVGG